MEKSESEFQSGKEKRIFCEELENAVWHVCSIVSESETLWTIAHQASLYMGFPWQAHWSGLSFPSPGGLPDTRVELGSPHLLLSHQGRPGFVRAQYEDCEGEELLEVMQRHELCS